jgi:hypothetical protein
MFHELVSSPHVLTSDATDIRANERSEKWGWMQLTIAWRVTVGTNDAGERCQPSPKVD